LIRQAAALCFGLIKNHPWVGGNKRTATHLTDRFLKLNGQEMIAAALEILELVYAVETDRWDVGQIEK
jgi:death-on-curing protein